MREMYQFIFAVTKMNNLIWDFLFRTFGFWIMKLQNTSQHLGYASVVQSTEY